VGRLQGVLHRIRLGGFVARVVFGLSAVGACCKQIAPVRRKGVLGIDSDCAFLTYSKGKHST